MGPFWGVVFHEYTSSKTKFRSKGAELFYSPTRLIAPMLLSYFPFPIQKLPFAPLGLTDEERPPRLPRLLRDDDRGDRHVH